MAWRASRQATVVAVLCAVTGCSPRTRAALVPRLVVHLTAAERRSSGGEEREGAASQALSRRHTRWDVVLHAELRWRSSAPSSFYYRGFP